MKYRLEIQQPTVTKDKYGAENTVYTTVRIVHAERVKTSGARSEEMGEHFPDYSAQFNVRYEHPIEENWRVKQLGGYLYTVTNIVPNIDRGMKTLICARVNE